MKNATLESLGAMALLVVCPLGLDSDRHVYALPPGFRAEAETFAALANPAGDASRTRVTETSDASASDKHRARRFLRVFGSPTEYLLFLAGLLGRLAGSEREK